jgi:hypothetical protein
MILILILSTQLIGADVKVALAEGDNALVKCEENELTPNVEYELTMTKRSRLIYGYKDAKKPSGELVISNGEEAVWRDKERAYFEVILDKGSYKIKFSAESKETVVVLLAVDEK